MKKKFFSVATFLAFKAISDETFEKMEADKRNELLNELAKSNEEYFAELEGAIENKLSKEEIESLKASQALVKSEIERLSLELKKAGEKGGSIEKSEIEKFIERDRSDAVSKKRMGYEHVAVKAAALMTTANVIPNVTGGFNQLFGNYIDPTIHSTPKPDNFIMNLVDVATAPGTENIWYVDRINEEGQAQFIGEGSLKPLADGEWKESKADIKEVAVRWKMSNRLINHAPSVVSDFRLHADELMEQEIDNGVLSGDGTGNNLNGIVEFASPFIVPTQLANYYASANIFDVIMAVATYVRLNNFKGQLTCVLNTVWQAKMMGIKNADGDYIMPAFVTRDGKQVGETRILFENKMDEDAILLGDLRKFKVRISENIGYYEGWENDDFSKNLSSRKLEAFLGTYMPTSYAGAIIYDDIATILTSIEVEAPVEEGV